MKEENKEGETFEVQVNDTVGRAEQHPGSGKAEEKNIMEKVLERKVALSKEYVEPHKIVTRKVVDKDIKRVVHDSKVMQEMCLVGRADYTTAFAIAHPQITKDDPLRFFVKIDGQVIVNPVITNHTNQIIERKEGCMSFPGEPMKVVERYNKITVNYQKIFHTEKEGLPISEPELTEVMELKLSGTESEVFQHELSHLNGHNMYEEDAKASHCLGEVY